MSRSLTDEGTRMTASLPRLDVEIVHRELPDEKAEVVTIEMRATPSFDTAVTAMAPQALSALMQFNPMLVWMNTAASAWTSLLGSATSFTQIGGANRSKS